MPISPLPSEDLENKRERENLILNANFIEKKKWSTSKLLANFKSMQHFSGKAQILLILNVLHDNNRNAEI